MEIMQVNLHVDVDGEEEYFVTKYSENGYTGRLIDTTYSNGISYTDWNVFSGTLDECQEYIKMVNNENN